MNREKTAETEKRNKYYWLWLTVTWAAVLLCVCLQYSVGKYGLDTPFVYDNENDLFGVFGNMTRAGRDGNLFGSSLLGAPFGADYSSMLSLYEAPLQYFFIRIVYLISGNIFVCFNLLLILLPLLNSGCAFICCKQMNISPYASAAASAVFALSTFYFTRTEHFMYLAYFCVPLITLICYWICTDPDYLNFNWKFYKNAKNIATVVFLLVTAGTGNIYYQFFNCFFVLAAGFACSIRERKPAYVLKSLAVILGIVIFLLINMSPAIIYILKNGYTSSQERNFEASELYSLQIIQLIMPYYSHGVKLLDDMILRYGNTAMLINENRRSYLGLIGVFGLICLILYLFNRKDGKNDKRLELLSNLNLCGILLGTFGGGSAVFAFFITTKLRGYNRISIYILFFCAAAAAIFIDYILSMLKSKNIKTIFALFTAAAVVLGIWEQTPPVPSENIEYNYAVTTQRKEFYGEIDKLLPDGAMIYQMPYCKYPEGASKNAYFQTEGIFYSDNLRWSYGSAENTAGDKWHKELSESDLQSRLSSVCAAGFDGVCLYKSMFSSEEEFNSINESISDLTGEKPISDDYNEMYFYDLRGYAEKIRDEAINVSNAKEEAGE